MSYIERDKAIEYMEYVCKILTVRGGKTAADIIKRYAIRHLKSESSIPSADVKPVIRGTWTLNKDGSGTCSECGRTQSNCWDLDNWDNFCHFCGADMRGRQHVDRGTRRL